MKANNSRLTATGIPDARFPWRVICGVRLQNWGQSMITTYCVSEISKKSIEDYQWLNDNFMLGEIGHQDEREITRLLENVHYPHIAKALMIINEYGPISEEIGESLLICNDCFVFERLLAELFLFAHLYAHNGPSVIPIRRIKNTKSPDFLVKLDELELLIELYSPIDFYGYQLFERLLSTTIKNLDIELGFKLKIELTAADTGYAYDFPEFRRIYSWINEFQAKFICFLGNDRNGKQFEFHTPAESVKLNIEVVSVNDDRDVRQLCFSLGTKSTDTIQYFRLENSAQFATTQWGWKINDKLSQRQAGPPSDNNIRILAINLALADTTDLKFLNNPKIQRNYTNHIAYLSSDIQPNPSYDIVILCKTSVRCGFAKPVLLSKGDSSRIQGLLDRIGLTERIMTIPRASKEETERTMKEMIEYGMKKDKESE